MKRKLTFTMLLSLSAASAQALALGLGDVEVRSTLNAPLRASIPLTDTAGLEAGLLNASVADPGAYQAAGLTRTPLAASVQLEVSRRQGQLVLDLATERAVREPWLDLLLRFDWPGGRQFREVTLLLDPPNYAAMPVLIGSSRPGQDTRVTQATSTSAPASRRAVAPSMPADPRDPARVRSGDTLWAVAGRLRPDSGIGMNQMMLALVEANPEVFPTGNINQMRAGVTLVVPPREAIAARSSEAAADLVQAMNQAWANRGSGAPAQVPLSAETEPTAVAGAETPAVEAAAPSVGDEAADIATRRAEAADSGPRLTLLTEAEAAAAGLGNGRRADTAPARDGGQGDGQQAAPRERLDPSVFAAITGTGELSEDQRLLRLERRWQENREALAAVQAERDALEEEVGDLRGELAALRQRVEALAAGGSGVDGAGAGGVVSPGSEPADASPPWWGALYQGATERPLLLGGAGLAALLALWGLVRRRRRREEEPAFPFGEVQVAEPSGGTPQGRTPPTPAAAPERPPANAVRASMPEAEAINEADIFIAYGRYDQARELLEAGLAREPERDDLRLKLLKVQLEQGDRPAARQEAQRLRESGNTATRAEVERLMARHAAPAASPAGERAVFPEPSELPPRVFGDPDAPESEEEAGPPASDGEAARDASRAPPAADDGEPDDLARYRPPEVDAGAEDEGRDQPVPTGRDEAFGAPPPGPSSEPSSTPDTGNEEPPMPQVTSRTSEEGREIIDYRPPSLDEATPVRQETPMQPGVDFTPAGREAPSEDDDAQSRESSRDPSRWEVEEVAFPPLGGDNGASSGAASSTATLGEARHLLDLGEVREARILLERLLEASHDAGAREEARELLDRHQP
ncbi:FimV/HubP family polar landmark protein [Halomonas sp. M4R1S46]|uniref:FimV/HubP family polar landmark protein n=1 Tax=Halomonas sp. M4R1S46 TaxID=2982692 RepID=UPI0021E3B837|nr:FimV/HubP family polar landmark protein [Halomonas sp. M4R1S46]UYG06200.1 tetratricopeptide repeat protein [Halomonas sp. M4R1S46]